MPSGDGSWYRPKERHPPKEANDAGKSQPSTEAQIVVPYG
jgi:hypothetical protein